MEMTFNDVRSFVKVCCEVYGTEPVEEIIPEVAQRFGVDYLEAFESAVLATAEELGVEVDLTDAEDDLEMTEGIENHEKFSWYDFWVLVVNEIEKRAKSSD